MSCDSDDECTMDPQELLLYSSRNGDINVVNRLLEESDMDLNKLDVNFKGKSKSNLGWTALHLATYFGHLEVAGLLLNNGADGNAVNDAGDTPLHKAAFIGNEDLVILLLRHGVEVSIMNGEGKVPKDMSKTQDIHKLLTAAENNEHREKELRLLSAAREGDVENVHQLLKLPQPPNINCVDTQGNSCLHCAAYRGHTQLAVILLQNGIDSTIRNINGQLAVDLAKDTQMRQVLSVRPVRQIQRTATRYEGQLLKRSRFLGWKTIWAVLQRGVLSYYSNRLEASNNTSNRGDWKYLDSVKVNASVTDSSLLVLHFSDGTSHKLRVPSNATPSAVVVRQEWISAFKEHIAYSAYYLWGCDKSRELYEDDEEDEDEEVCGGGEGGGRPLGSMEDALRDAANQLVLLETQLGECDALVNALEKSVQIGTTLHQSTYMRFQHAASTGQRLLSVLKHCTALVKQADETRGARLKAERERCRVLEEALAVLAAEHHELEQSFAEQVSENKSSSRKNRHSRLFENSDDEFYDAFDADSGSDTIVSGGNLSPLGNLSSLDNTPHASRENSPARQTRPYNGVQHPNLTRSLCSLEKDTEEAVDVLNAPFSAISPASSCSTVMTYGGNVYRNASDDINRVLFMLHKSR